MYYIVQLQLSACYLQLNFVKHIYICEFDFFVIVMSQSKLKKYIERPLNFNGRLKRHPILLSDSKGFSLKPHVDLIQQFHHDIDIECRAGARFQDYFHWLRHNLARNVNYFGHIALYLFLGTCDLSCKSGRKVELRHEDDTVALAYLQFQIDRVVLFVSKFPTVKLIFLEIPPYSIEAWNRAKRCSDLQLSRSQDFILLERIALVNEYIRIVNERSLVTSPRFRLDLLKFRKEKGGKQRVSLNFSNYKDGIHPTCLLARCWMKRIVAQILTDCS